MTFPPGQAATCIGQLPALCRLLHTRTHSHNHNHNHTTDHCPDAPPADLPVNGDATESPAANGEVKVDGEEGEDGQEQAVENVFQLTIQLPHAPVSILSVPPPPRLPFL